MTINNRARPFIHGTAIALVAMVVTAPLKAQPRRPLTASVARAPSNNSSDNSGVNTGSSGGTAGGTFVPDAGGATVTPAGSSGGTSTGTADGGAGGTGATGSGGTSGAAANAGGAGVTSTGPVGGAITTPPGQIIQDLQTGSVNVTTSAGGTITASLPPAAGQALAAALQTPSAANGANAGQAVSNVLSMSGLPTGVVSAVSAAVTSIGTTGTVSGGTMSTAIGTVQTALSSGSVTPDQAKGLVAVLMAMRAGVAK
jgi:hypothetical protein